jgi:hypothetical protein
MDPPPPSRLSCRIEHRRPDGAVALLGAAAGLRASAWAFEEAFLRLAEAGGRGTLALVCEVMGGEDLPLAVWRLGPGLAG